MSGPLLPPSPDTETLIGNLLDACVSYERSEGFEAKYRRQDLEEAKQAVRDAIGVAQKPQGPDLAKLLKAAHQNNLALWEALNGGPSPQCRDCADFNGRCQGKGEFCDPQERALDQIRRLRAASVSETSTRSNGK